MNATKQKFMLALIWVGVITLTGVAGGQDKSPWDWILWAVHAGLLTAMAVALRYLYGQIKANAIREYRFNLLWEEFRQRHKLANGAEGEE